MIRIVDGNLFESGADVICHQVNCQGIMDNGIALQIKERFGDVFLQYRDVCEGTNISKSLLGTICDVKTELNGKPLVVCNLFGQDHYKSGFCFIDYAALKACLEKVKQKYGDKKIALPYRMSCSLSGGDWRTVEEIILDVLGDCDVTICRHVQ